MDWKEPVKENRSRLTGPTTSAPTTILTTAYTLPYSLLKDISSCQERRQEDIR